MLWRTDSESENTDALQSLATPMNDRETLENRQQGDHSPEPLSAIPSSSETEDGEQTKESGERAGALRRQRGGGGQPGGTWTRAEDAALREAVQQFPKIGHGSNEQTTRWAKVAAYLSLHGGRPGAKRGKRECKTRYQTLGGHLWSLTSLKMASLLRLQKSSQRRGLDEEKTGSTVESGRVGTTGRAPPGAGTQLGAAALEAAREAAREATREADRGDANVSVPIAVSTVVNEVVLDVDVEVDQTQRPPRDLAISRVRRAIDVGPPVTFGSSASSRTTLQVREEGGFPDDFRGLAAIENDSNDNELHGPVTLPEFGMQPSRDLAVKHRVVRSSDTTQVCPACQYVFTTCDDKDDHHASHHAHHMTVHGSIDHHAGHHAHHMTWIDNGSDDELSTDLDDDSSAFVEASVAEDSVVKRVGALPSVPVGALPFAAEVPGSYTVERITERERVTERIVHRGTNENTVGATAAGKSFLLGNNSPSAEIAAAQEAYASMDPDTSQHTDLAVVTVGQEDSFSDSF